jgi:3'-5' exoribonuclease
MKSPYVSELLPNQAVTAIFLVQHKDIRQKKTGEPYLSMVLGDRTGDLEAKMWDNVAEVMDTFERDDFLKVRGLLQVYQNKLQLTVHKLQKQHETQIDFTDYFPSSERNVEEMFAELMGRVERMRDPHLKALLTSLLTDPEIGRRYKLAPAAKTIHHAYLSGLLEHVLSLCTLAEFTSRHYRGIDADLLLTGVVVHDIGKIYELTYDRSFSYTAEGQLLGHMVIALRMIGDKLRDLPDFPPRLRTLVEHLIISHHGELEFGSPKLPLFPEAMLLHHLDNLDSKMEAIRVLIGKDRHVEGFFTAFSPALERSVLKKDKYLANQPDTPEEPMAEMPELPPAPASPDTPAPKPASQPQFKPQSLFGEKLQGALIKE